MFCPKCGSKKVVDVFCAECLKAERPLVKGYKEFVVDVCTRCAKYKHKGTWHEAKELGVALAEELATHVVFAPYATIERVRVEPLPVELKDGLKITGEAVVVVTGKASEKARSYEEEYLFPYTVQNTHCKRCGKHGTSYFEGTLQVRRETSESKEFVRVFVSEAGASAAKVVKVGKEGTDYFLTRKNVIEKTAHALQERYGALLKSSAHLFGRDKQRSKDVYRMTWLAELPPFTVGDVIDWNGEPLWVRELGKKIRLYTFKRGKTTYLQYKGGLISLLPVVETTVAATHPEFTVIHPESFQPTKVWNEKRSTHEPGERVIVTVHEGRVYLVETGKQ